MNYFEMAAIVTIFVLPIIAAYLHGITKLLETQLVLLQHQNNMLKRISDSTYVGTPNNGML